jgi:hypothetical protein
MSAWALRRVISRLYGKIFGWICTAGLWHSPSYATHGYDISNGIGTQQGPMVYVDWEWFKGRSPGF